MTSGGHRRATSATIQRYVQELLEAAQDVRRAEGGSIPGVEPRARRRTSLIAAVERARSVHVDRR
ncbi:MAG TPA: hypothetical protein VHY83_12125 [Solirubrobacteraceae bacterium]|jgi:hypothetical protein|nr:hypothetical protein [Solirubrobacteraceae bacterium]